MAYQHNTLVLPGLRANSTGLATSQFLAGFVASTAGLCVLATALNTTTIATRIVGVIQNKPGAYEEVELAVAGVAKIKIASTDVAVGDWLSVNSTGQGLKNTTDNRGVIGRALEAATGTNDVISVLLVPGNARY